MALTKSAKKDGRKNAQRKARNLGKKREMKKLIKKIRTLSVSDKEEAKKLVPQAAKAIDKSAKAGILKKNTASRKKSLVNRLVK